MSISEVAIDMLSSLPDDLPWDEWQYQRYVREVVEESDQEFEAGHGVSHEEAKQQLKKWLE